MPNKIPQTPFATRLSGSAKETQLRIRNIFQWKKQRPPVWLFAFIVVVIFGCLGMVSCRQQEQSEPAPSVEETAPKDGYGEFFTNYQTQFSGYTYSGEMEFISDKLTLTLKDVPENALEELLIAKYNHKNFQTVVIHTFYTLAEEDFTPGGDWFADEEYVDRFVQELRDLIREHALTRYAVVCADVTYAYTPEVLALGPQDGDGRYYRPYLAGKTSEDDTWKLYGGFMGEFTFGKPNTSQTIFERAVLSELFTASNVSDVVATPVGQLLVAPAAEGQSFCAGYFTERDNYELVIGVWDAETGGLVGTPFRAANSGGTPKVVAFEWEGEQRLLYTANGVSQGFSGGQAGLIRLVDGEMEWTWPVDGDIREQTRDSIGQPYNEYLEYWENHLALMSPSGVEIFVENPDYGLYEGSPQQWTYEEMGHSRFDGQTLVDSDQEKIRAWLEEFGRTGNNALDLKNDSASWRILALERSGLHKKCTLLCASEYDENTYLRATLRMDHFRQEPLEVLDWEIGTSTPEAIQKEAASYSRLSSKRDRLIQEYMKIQYPRDQVYFMEYLDEEVAPGYAAITGIEPIGSAPLNEDTIGAVYRVTMKTHLVSMNGGTQGEFIHTVVLSCDNNMELNGILGEFRGSGGMSLEEIVQRAGEGEYELEISLWHDDDPYLVPLRLGAWNESIFKFDVSDPTVEPLDGWEPIYAPGDYWDEYARDGITALRYYHAEEDYFSAYTIDMTRDDFSTQRGVRVGDTKEAVKSAYPELKSGDYWTKYPGEDYLWYCEDANDFGPALIFFFEHDKVSQITLNNMFN